MYDLYSEFDLEEHKKNYTNYLEVIIEPNGHVCYAVPSHQIFLEKYGAKINNISREEFVEKCPKEYWCDYLTWLLKETKCVSVWSIGYMKPSNVTKEQENVLKHFIKEQIMKDNCLN